MTVDQLPHAAAERLRELCAGLPPHAQAELLRRVRAQIAERRAVEAAAYTPAGSPGALAIRLGEQQRPHLRLLDRLIERARAGEVVRAAVSMPPRHGKSRRLLHVGPTWRLDEDPDCRVMMVSGSKSLVEQASRWVRDELERPDGGYRVAPRRDVRSVSDWQIAGHTGGIFVGSMNSRIIGRGANLLLVDDLLGSQKEAESEVYREAAWRFLQAAFGRLEPRASVIIVNSRWHADDPIGRLLREQPGRWEYLAVPAVAERHGFDPEHPDRCLCGDPWFGSHADPIGRAPGEPLWPERYDLAALADKRLELGAHLYSAQYQQRPKRREGGLWREEWITERRADAWTVEQAVAALTARTVAVDPSASDETGGDEAGIVCGGRDKAAGDTHVTHDLSGTYTPEGWARAALVAAVELDADVVYERNLTPAFMRRAFATAWEQLKRDAAKDKAARLAAGETNPTGHVDPVLGLAPVELPRLMPTLTPVRAKVGKELRAGPVAQRYEQRRVVHHGVFPTLEEQQLTWKPTDSDSPDRLDALVHLVTHVGDAAETTTKVEQPQGVVPTGAAAVTPSRFR